MKFMNMLMSIQHKHIKSWIQTENQENKYVRDHMREDLCPLHCIRAEDTAAEVVEVEKLGYICIQKSFRETQSCLQDDII